jgi:hypothetical protein
VLNHDNKGLAQFYRRKENPVANREEEVLTLCCVFYMQERIDTYNNSLLIAIVAKMPNSKHRLPISCSLTTRSESALPDIAQVLPFFE